MLIIIILATLGNTGIDKVSANPNGGIDLEYKGTKEHFDKVILIW